MFRHEIKLGVFGGVVGKTSLINRNIENVFVATNPTISDTYKHIIDVDGEQVKLDILDTNGTEQFVALNQQYIRGADGVILVYSIASRESFEFLHFYYDEIPIEKQSGSRNSPIIIAGNANDLENKRQVTFEEGQELANKLGADFIECSARTGDNVNGLLQTIVLSIIYSKSNKRHQ